MKRTFYIIIVIDNNKATKWLHFDKWLLTVDKVERLLRVTGLHDIERTEFLKKEGWTLIGRCNWSKYQKLSKVEKEKYVRDIEQKILTGNPNG